MNFILLIQHCPFVFDSYQYLQPLTPPVQQPQTTYWDSTPRAPPRLLLRLAAFSWMFSILSDQVHRPMEWIQMDWHREQKRALRSMWIVLSSSLYVCICWALCFGVICMFIVFQEFNLYQINKLKLINQCFIFQNKWFQHYSLNTFHVH